MVISSYGLRLMSTRSALCSAARDLRCRRSRAGAGRSVTPPVYVGRSWTSSPVPDIRAVQPSMSPAGPGVNPSACAAAVPYRRGVKHVTMADKSLMLGDEAADLLIDYAALLAQIGSGDRVELRALGTQGELVDVVFLLNSGTVLLAETSPSVMEEPDNSEGIAYLRSRIESYGLPSADGADPFGAES